MSKIQIFKQEDISGEKKGTIILNKKNTYNNFIDDCQPFENQERKFDVYLEKDTVDKFFIVINGIAKILNEEDCKNIVFNNSFLTINIKELEEMKIKGKDSDENYIVIKGFFQKQYEEIRKFFYRNFIEGQSYGYLDILFDRIIFKIQSKKGMYVFHDNGNFEYFGLEKEFGKTLELFKII